MGSLSVEVRTEVLCGRICDLEAENARLRELLEDDSEQLDKWQKKAEYYSQLSQLDESENNKLREFIDLKESCWKYVGWCDKCPYNGLDDEHDVCNCTAQERIILLTRELGIEA